LATNEWARYPETVLTFATEPPVLVDLRVPVSRHVRDVLRAIGIDGCFGVLTAYNPRGENIPDEENRLRSTQLEAELESSGERFVRVEACSPDKSHCEPSVALAASLERSVKFAGRYEQVAVFWFDGDSFWIKPVLSDLPELRLPIK
jgi:uncharacterized protein DUF3293